MPLFDDPDYDSDRDDEFACPGCGSDPCECDREDYRDDEEDED